MIHRSELPTDMPGGKYINPQELTRRLNMLDNVIGVEEEEDDGYSGGEPQDGNIEFNPDKLEIAPFFVEYPKDAKEPNKGLEMVHEDKTQEITSPNTVQGCAEQIAFHMEQVLMLVDKMVELSKDTSVWAAEYKKKLMDTITKL